MVEEFRTSINAGRSSTQQAARIQGRNLEACVDIGQNHQAFWHRSDQHSGAPQSHFHRLPPPPVFAQGGVLGARPFEERRSYAEQLLGQSRGHQFSHEPLPQTSRHSAGVSYLDVCLTGSRPPHLAAPHYSRDYRRRFDTHAATAQSVHPWHIDDTGHGFGGPALRPRTPSPVRATSTP
jgi:hypothetical protein